MADNESKNKKATSIIVVLLIMIALVGIFAVVATNTGIFTNPAMNFVILDIPRIITEIDSASTGQSHHAEADFSVRVSGSRRSNLDVEELKAVIENALSYVNYDEVRASGDIGILSQIAYDAILREFPDDNIDRVMVRGFVFYFRLP